MNTYKELQAHFLNMCHSTYDILWNRHVKWPTYQAIGLSLAFDQVLWNGLNDAKAPSQPWYASTPW